MAPLHIATVAYEYCLIHGRVRGLAEAAVDAGHQVDIISLRQPQEKRHEVYEGVNVYRVPLQRGWSSSIPVTIFRWCLFTLMAGITLTRLHLKHRFDVIHVHTMPDFLVFSALLPRLLGAKVIIDVQDASPELMAQKTRGRLRNFVKLLATCQERISTNFADHVVTVGCTGEQVLMSRGVPREKLTSIHNSSDPKLFPPSRRIPPSSQSNKQDAPFILMYHGTVEEWQGLDVAIRALALARHAIPRLRLDIKGFGHQLPAIKQLAIDLGVSEHVVFSDKCPIGEVVDFVAHGDVGIIPYQKGGYMELVLPVKAFEFAWMHKPMIASDTRGMRSIFRPESVAYCDPSKPESFAEAIIDLYKHPEKQTTLIANAAEDYMPYSWETEARRYQQLLVSLRPGKLEKGYQTTESLPVLRK